MIKLNDEDMREAKKSLKEKGIKPEDVKNLPPIEDICEITPPSSMIEKGKMKKFKFGELFKKATTSTGRPSRASTQIRRSYNEDVIAPSFAPEEDHGAPNASSFPCYEFLTNAGILDDFFTLVNRAGLATYVGDERGQYYRLTKVFVESFKFHNTEYEPTVAFKIYDIPVTMKLEEFCRALGIAPVGTARRIDDNPRDLLELYRGITGDDCRTIQRGKIRNIQLPAIKYFAYYIATSILGRENTSNISSYHLAFLNVALTGETPYHLGSLIARRLSSRGPIFGGTIALRILTHLDIPLDSNDVPLTPRKLDIAAMKSHHFVTTDSTIDNMVYRMLFADGNEKEIPLPQTVAIPYTCGSSRLFSGAVAGEHSFIWKFTWIDIVRCKFSIMGKPRDTKIAILPSTTRKGTTLSTSAALDSPSVISKLVSPPQTSNVGTSAESEISSHNCDDASAVLDNDGSLGSFLDATIAKSRQIENTETPNENAATPVNSPESVEYLCCS
ncbi:hypothetical protein QYE76_055467 [Lolium multiflorum]|uniref:Arabidopsis retrotransposon Orf1 C-terminal domain-containing protein n=1 Tax=Lolium multiflorum TaxID=4521 RepID=A0AAD8T1G0_LOLMU|nr:hypothetical protein QYE76_055467 [Lolium multiflorum]